MLKIPGFPDFPRYTLTAPLIIGYRLAPAIAVGDGFVSVEATAIESDGRAHFRFYIDAPSIDSYTSADSDVTVMGRDWTHAAMMALETVLDALGSDDGPAIDLPADVTAWLAAGAYMDASVGAEDLREALEAWPTDSPDVQPLYPPGNRFA